MVRCMFLSVRRFAVAAAIVTWFGNISMSFRMMVPFPAPLGPATTTASMLDRHTSHGKDAANSKAKRAVGIRGFVGITMSLSR